MAFSFRVVDLTNDIVEMDQVVEGVGSPEAAARQVLGIDVMRSGAKADLVARVYWQPMGSPMSMVRPYRRAS